jgi:hypothetical protein
MPRTADDVENYLLSLDRRYENDGGTLLVSSGPNLPPIAIRVVPPVVAVRVNIGPEPDDLEHRARLFRRLLQFNAEDLMHASYGIEDSTVVLSAALELENLDKNELHAVLSDIDVALARHVPELHGLANE